MIGCAGVWMQRATADRLEASHCIDACLTVAAALEVLGIHAHLEPVQVAVESDRDRSR